ncbi:MAG: Sulfotransferase [Pseudomonadota bacterium]|nr:Sulfotransferase [Pseudomonadota bacterium]
MKLLLAAFIIVGFLTAILAPFPYWPTYRLLWRSVLHATHQGIPWRTRRKQALFLTRYALFAPFYTLFWYLDELFFPVYRQTPVHPIFIIGQPRSGTTLLHRTLAADDRTFFAIRHIEWRYPFLTVQKILNATRFAQHLLQRNYWPDTEIGRQAARMHPNTMADWEEDGIFFEERFLHHFFLFLRFPYPEILPLVDKFRELPAPVRQRMLHTHLQVIRKIAYLRNRPHAFYLSKEVTSHSKFPELLALYPDARFIVVVRNAAHYMGSLFELMRASTASKTGIDPTTIPGWTEAFIERMQCDSLRLVDLCRNIIPSEQQIPVSYAYLFTHIRETVEVIYARLGLAPSPDFLASLDELDAHQKNRERGYVYTDLSLSDFADFDQFVAQIEQRFFALLPNAPAVPTDLSTSADH